jgi:hypothetical protein
MDGVVMSVISRVDVNSGDGDSETRRCETNRLE